MIPLRTKMQAVFVATATTHNAEIITQRNKRKGTNITLDVHGDTSLGNLTVFGVNACVARVLLMVVVGVVVGELHVALRLHNLKSALHIHFFSRRRIEIGGRLLWGVVVVHVIGCERVRLRVRHRELAYLTHVKCTILGVVAVQLHLRRVVLCRIQRGRHHHLQRAHVRDISHIRLILGALHTHAHKQEMANEL